MIYYIYKLNIFHSIIKKSMRNSFSKDNQVNNIDDDKENKVPFHLGEEDENKSKFYKSFIEVFAKGKEEQPESFSESARENMNKTTKESNNCTEEIDSPKTKENKAFFDFKSIQFKNIFEAPDNILLNNLELNIFFSTINEEDLNNKTQSRGKISSIIKTNKANKKRKEVFRIVCPSNFKIFHLGNYEQYPRNLINLISENNIIFKKNKKRKIRKHNADNIRKKIKSRFLKTLKAALNERLKLAGSKHLFNYLPQDFIVNVGKDQNRGAMYLTFKEVFSKDFSKGDKAKDINLKKCLDNKLVLDYLEKNIEVSAKSNFCYYKNMKYYEIYDEYINSREFEDDIIRLKEKEGEPEIYIKKYINLALELNDFFTSDGRKM